MDIDDELVPAKAALPLAKPADADLVLFLLASGIAVASLGVAPNAELAPNTELPPKGLGFEVKFPKADFAGCADGSVALPKDVAELPKADARGRAAGAITCSAFVDITLEGPGAA